MILRIPALSIKFLSLNAIIISTFYIIKMLTPTPSLNK